MISLPCCECGEYIETDTNRLSIEKISNNGTGEYKIVVSFWCPMCGEQAEFTFFESHTAFPMFLRLA